jgi:flagellar assembly factor FliW
MTTAPSTPLNVQTRFGTFTADVADIVTLEDGIPGFERCRRFVLVSSDAIAPFTCVQGLDEPRPSFLAIPPRLLDPQYVQHLTPADRVRLDAADDGSLVWMAFVRLTGDAASVNLRAPLVINPRRMIGLQLMPADSSYALDHPMVLD